MQNMVNEIVYTGVRLIEPTAREWDHGEVVEASLDPVSGKITFYEFIDENQIYNEFILQNNVFG